jgi:ATP-dependent Clp protease ATP-binding subunit ClpB
VFHALDEKNIGAIAKVQLRILEQRLEKMEMKLEISEKALQRIAEAGFDPLYGARPLKRAIQQQLENPLSKQILEGRFGPKDVIAVDVKDDRLVFEKAGG